MNTEPWYYAVIGGALLGASWVGVFYLALVMS